MHYSQVLFSLIVIVLLLTSLCLGDPDTAVSVSEVVVYRTEDGSDLLIRDGVVYAPTGTQIHNVQVVPNGWIECVSEVPLFSEDFWVYLGICIGLVAFGGLMSGLTVGYFAIDPLKVALFLRKDPASKERKMADKVQPVLAQHHRLLVTLLLANAVVMEALPLFLNVLVPDWLAILLSVSFVLIFGEVIPQALCTKDPLSVGAKCAWFVRILMILLSPLCYPIAWLLDKLLGHSEVGPESMSKSEIKALLDIQAEKSSYLLSGDDPEREPLNHAHTLDVSGISLYEASIMKSALDLDRRTAMDILIPMKFAFMLDYNTDLDLKVLRSISSSGFSRIPVYSKTKNNIKGIAHINSLIMVNPADKMPLNTIPLRNPIFVSPSASLMQLLTIFRNGESHLAIITESYNACEQFAKIKKDLPPDAKILGIVTLEDVLEELIQEEIYDENELSSESPKRKVALLCSKSQIMSQSSKRRHMYSKSLEIRKENRSLRVSNSHPDFQNISFLTEFSGSGSINSSDQNQSA